MFQTAAVNRLDMFWEGLKVREVHAQITSLTSGMCVLGTAMSGRETRMQITPKWGIDRTCITYRPFLEVT